MREDANFESILFTQNFEKSFIDKILSRQDAERLKELMKKDLTHDELLELLYLLAGIEIKLTNLDEWNRYLLGKYFVWIREFVFLAENIFEYENKIDELDNESLEYLENIRHNIIHAVKFNCDVYLYLLRSALSINGIAFDTLTKSRFEYYYPQTTSQPQESTNNKPFFGFFLR